MAKTWPVFLTLFLLITASPTQAAVVLNEIFANPVDENEEFIELYNSGDQAVIISGYKVADLSKSFAINEATMAAKSFYLLKKADTKIALNNDTETVTLKDSGDLTLDSFSYDGTIEGKSYSRLADGGNWLAGTEPTTLSANQAPPSPTPSPSVSPSPNPSTEHTNPSPSPSTSLGNLDPSPSPSPSPSHKIKSISLLSPLPELTLGTQSASLPPSVNSSIDWQLPLILLAAGAGIILTTAVIIVKLWRKN